MQGPALKLLVDREREIQAFTPEPYWEIYLDGDYKNHAVEAKHISDKITDKTEAERILQVVKGKKEAAVSKVSRTIRNQAPPYPLLALLRLYDMRQL